MRNMFYFNISPMYRNIPNSFYSYYPRINRGLISSGLNFQSMIQTAQKGINTINQIIPLYKQVKPIYSQAKNSFNSLKKYFVKKPTKPTSNHNLKDNSVYTTSSNTKNEANDFIYTNNGPSSPFF